MLEIDVQGIIAFDICFLAAFLLAAKRKDVGAFVMIGIALRFLMVIWYSLSEDTDPDGYGMRAVAYAFQPIGDVLASMPTGAYIYSWLISFLYRVFGESPMMIRAINALMSSVAILFAYDLMQRLSDRSSARLAAAFLALFPSLLRFSASFASRESLFVFLILLVVRELYAFYSEGRVPALILATFAFILGCIVHTAFFMLGILFIYAILKGTVASRNAWWIARMIGMTALAAIVLLLMANGIGTEKFYLDQGGLSLEKLNWISESSAMGRASYLKGFTSNRPILFLLLIPVRVAYFLFAPFVWMVRTKADALGLFDALLYLFVMILLVGNLLDILRRSAKTANDRFILCLAFVVLLMVVALAIGTSNYGTALRHRAKLICILVLMCGRRFRLPAVLTRRE